ncbi:hypothetical protein J6A31_04685 [bacterium]|nr:hypothetical protein [bacterium]
MKKFWTGFGVGAGFVVTVIAAAGAILTMTGRLHVCCKDDDDDVCPDLCDPDGCEHCANRARCVDGVDDVDEDYEHLLSLSDIFEENEGALSVEDELDDFTNTSESVE